MRCAALFAADCHKSAISLAMLCSMGFSKPTFAIVSSVCLLLWKHISCDRSWTSSSVGYLFWEIRQEMRYSYNIKFQFLITMSIVALPGSPTWSQGGVHFIFICIEELVPGGHYLYFHAWILAVLANWDFLSLQPWTFWKPLEKEDLLECRKLSANVVKWFYASDPSPTLPLKIIRGDD